MLMLASSLLRRYGGSMAEQPTRRAESLDQYIETIHIMAKDAARSQSISARSKYRLVAAEMMAGIFPRAREENSHVTYTVGNTMGLLTHKLIKGERYPSLGIPVQIPTDDEIVLLDQVSVRTNKDSLRTESRIKAAHPLGTLLVATMAIVKDIPLDGYLKSAPNDFMPPAA
jgi:hypothetical protein